MSKKCLEVSKLWNDAGECIWYFVGGMSVGRCDDVLMVFVCSCRGVVYVV